jgi:hemolysin III
VLLIVVAVRGTDPWKIVSFSAYAAILLILHLTSSLYHSLQGAAKNVLRKMDHCAIYLLIAGSYTPFTLAALRGVYGWSMFGVVWTLALFGTVRASLATTCRLPSTPSII